MGVFMFTFYMSLTEIGQEGSAFLNLVINPLKEEEIIRSKLTTALLPPFFALIALIAFIQVMAQVRLEVLIVVIVTLFAALFECAFVGLALGSRFPDFTEVPRARFVDQKGVLLGMLLISVCIVVTFLPPFLYSLQVLEWFPLFAAPVLSGIVCVLISYAGYRATLSSLKKLMCQG